MYHRPGVPVRAVGDVGDGSVEVAFHSFRSRGNYRAPIEKAVLCLHNIVTALLECRRGNLGTVHTLR